MEQAYKVVEVKRMEEKLIYLIFMMLKQHATDVHFLLQNDVLEVHVRGLQGFQRMQEDIFDQSFYMYLKYISDLDLANANQPQSGRFSRMYEQQEYHFRFSIITTLQLQTGVLRILNNHSIFKLEQLTYQKDCILAFKKWMKFRTGMVLLCGPTGSGKTTTLHTLLHIIATQQKRKVITLEDPIEIIDSAYVQLQINEKVAFTYEEGIRQLLRHDPDVIMLGEIRDSNTAKMAYRCALTGHLVFSTIHAKNALEVVHRLMDLGLETSELNMVLKGVAAQRLCVKKRKKERTCIYEILNQEELQTYFEHQVVAKGHQTIHEEIKNAVYAGIIDEKEALYDLEDI